MGFITNQAAAAFIKGYDFKKGNTRVVIEPKQRRCFYVYNSLIAIYEDEDVYISHDCEPTTEKKDRINGILELLDKHLIYQEDKKWYWKNGLEIKAGWNRI